MKRTTLASLLTAAFAISLSTYAQAQSSGPFTDREIGDREGATIVLPVGDCLAAAYPADRPRPAFAAVGSEM